MGQPRPRAAALALVAAVAAIAPASAQELAQRRQAAQATADGAAACAAIRPFYWEIGDREQTLVSGARGFAFGADSGMAIASASKLVYAAWVVQQRAGRLTDADITHLSFRSGYTGFTNCRRGDTVHACAERDGNASLDPAARGKFSYGGGHMQIHADRVMGLGDADNAALARRIADGLGLAVAPADFSYSQPQLAGGIHTTPRVYAGFLRKLLDGSLALGDQLGGHAVCTNARVCPGDALRSPFPSIETPRYSLGHWVEDDAHGDGTFSSPGAFGFYPWIDAGRRWYGIVARVSVRGSGGDAADTPYARSMQCGRAIRRAWISGQASAE